MSNLPEYFPFPLYHGTNSLFHDDIKRHGLNGFNPLGKYDLLTIIRNQALLLDTYCPMEADWLMNRYSTEQMLSQLDPRWQHAKTFLTCSERTARQFASNEYGSELLTRCFLLRSILYRANIHNSELDHLWHTSGPHDLENKTRKPLLLQLTQVQTCYLKNWYGLTIEHSISQIQEQMQMDEAVRESLLPQHVFYLERDYPVFTYTIIDHQP